MRKLIIVLALLTGCKATEKTYRKIATDTQVTTEKKNIISPWVSVHFPPTTEFVFGKPDTIVNVVYDELALGELSSIVDSLLMLPKDSVIQYLKGANKTRTVYVHRTDTLYKEDAGAVYSLKQQLAVCDQDVNMKLTEIKDLKEKVDKVKETRNYLIGVLCLIGFGVIVFFLAKLKIRP